MMRCWGRVASTSEEGKRQSEYRPDRLAKDAASDPGQGVDGPAVATPDEEGISQAVR